jgi:hypothetical protein
MKSVEIKSKIAKLDKQLTALISERRTTSDRAMLLVVSQEIRKIKRKIKSLRKQL